MSRPRGWGLSAERPRGFPVGTVAHRGPWYRPRSPSWYEPPLMAWFTFAFAALFKLATDHVLVPGWDLWWSPATGFADELAAYVLAMIATVVWVLILILVATGVVATAWMVYGWATDRVVPFL